MKVFSYVVDHDHGTEPNPYYGKCTLCRCKYGVRREQTQGRCGQKNVVELARPGDWVIGTGGASEDSVGRGRLVYAMLVDRVLRRGEFHQEFPKKSSEAPKNSFEREEQYALVSEHFYYFGKKAPDIEQFKLEKNPRGFHYVDEIEFERFRRWLESKFSVGVNGEPKSPKGQLWNEAKRCVRAIKYKSCC
jgi:hypothetical protein